MKKLKPILFVVGILIAGSVVYVGVKAFADNYLTQKNEVTTKSVECSIKGVDYFVTMQNDEMQPKATTAKRCDTLTIKNADAKLRRIGFGVHDHHVAYNGVAQKDLPPGQSFTITLSKTGTYLFHDHFQDEVSGTFTVN